MIGLSRLARLVSGVVEEVDVGPELRAVSALPRIDYGESFSITVPNAAAGRAVCARISPIWLYSPMLEQGAARAVHRQSLAMGPVAALVVGAEAHER